MGMPQHQSLVSLPTTWVLEIELGQQAYLSAEPSQQP